MTHLGDRIAAFVDGQLPADERRIAEEHVFSCDECLRKVREQRLLKSRMTSLGAVEAPEHLMASLSDLERLASASDPRHHEPGRLTRCLRSTPVRMLVAVTGASVTVTALAYGVGGPHRPADPEVRPAVEQFTAQFQRSAPTRRAGEATPEDLLAPTTETVTTSGIEPLTLDSRRVVGGDDDAAVGLLRDAAGRSTYLDQLLRNYRVTTGSSESVAGRTAVEVRVSRGGGLVASFWVDPVGDHLLRRVRYAGDGSVADTRNYYAASEPDAVAASGAGARSTAEGREAQIAAETLDALDASGWPCRRTLARDLARVQGHWVDVGNAHVVRLTYTDGLARLSLYEQRGRLDVSGLDGFAPYRLDGSTVWVHDGDDSRVAVWSAHGVVYTAVTDANAQRLRQVVAELPHDPATDDGSVDRVVTGLQRMGSWLGPV